MQDFLTALALVLVIEGMLYAAFPGPMKRMVAAALDAPDGILRGAGLAAAVIGLAAVWLLRG
ncbi:MAG: DUF2065 domain-containing protein [Alphaproteobacteria bacterium]|nr:DUF2065 domain-containing protein [Alphaproteobacteria bacterium]